MLRAQITQISIRAYDYVITNLFGHFELKWLHLYQLNCKLNAFLLYIVLLFPLSFPYPLLSYVYVYNLQKFLHCLADYISICKGKLYIHTGTHTHTHTYTLTCTHTIWDVISFLYTIAKPFF